MRNKLRRSKNVRPAEDQAQNTKVIILSSESSCSSDELLLGQDSTVLAASKQNDSVTGNSCVQGRDALITPIFSSAQFQNRNNEELSKKSPEIDLQHVKSVKLHPQSIEVKEVDPSTLDACIKEIQTSNPTFPVNRVFSTLQKKSEKYLACIDSLQNNCKDKGGLGHESYGSMHKRQRSSVATEDNNLTSLCHGVQDSPVPTPEKPPRANRLSRTRRLRHGSGKIHQMVNCESEFEGRKDKKTGQKSPKASDIFQRDSFCEDALWTDKYSPRHSSEVIGNSVPMEKLHSWLKKWKIRTDSEERRKFKEKQHEENSNDSWDCGDFQDEVGLEDETDGPLCNTILITGPPGIGKTASVYACALELGFKVFEVNCSSQRSGREVLSQLKEATQSHLVEVSGKDPLKPAFFNSCNTIRCRAKSDSYTAKAVSPKNPTLSNSKKRAVQNFSRSGCRNKVNPVTLTSYFKMKAKADYLYHGGSSPSKKPLKKLTSPNLEPKASQNMKMATSLILFEEVEIIFDDDVGFLTAIKTFMTTTKRPVILTTNDPLFRERFNSSLEEVIFKSPPVADVCSYLQLVCLAENVQLDLDDANTLLKVTRGDVRRCLLQLQLWVKSGGGLPKCPRSQQLNDTVLDHYKGCSANMLGLQSVTQGLVLQLLKHSFWTEQQMTELLQPTIESWKNGLPLLYSNLELLLHIEPVQSPFLYLDRTVCSGTDSKMALCDTQHMENTAKTSSRLSRKKSVASHTMPSKLTQFNHSPNGTTQKAPLADKTLRTNFLVALSDFFDIMSFIDATVPVVPGSSLLEEFTWTGAKIQDGLLDKMRDEEGNSYSPEGTLDIQASIEVLGFHKCWRQVSEVWTTARRGRQEVGGTQLERRSFPVSSTKKNLSFIFQPVCSPIVSQRRYELNKTVLSSRHFSLLHNRRAVSIEYLPVIRFICRTQRKHKHLQNEAPIRCVKSLRTQLGLSKLTIQHMAEEFP